VRRDLAIAVSGSRDPRQHSLDQALPMFASLDLAAATTLARTIPLLDSPHPLPTDIKGSWPPSKCRRDP
jgi:hypothetical protein